MSTIFPEMYRQSMWATLTLLDACVGLSEEQLAASAQGTYGQIRATLLHLVSAERRYVEQLTGTPTTPEVRESLGFPGFDALRESARATGEVLVTLAEQRNEDWEFLGPPYQGQRRTVRGSTVMVQAFNHATEHRQQVSTILTQIGVTPPDMSGWAYAQARDKAPSQESVMKRPVAPLSDSPTAVADKSGGEVPDRVGVRSTGASSAYRWQ